MTFNKCISVIIPSFNRAHLLRETIPTYIQDRVCEVIVIDDCSTDNTQEVLLELQQSYPEISFCRNDKNSKQTYSKNVGILKAKGEFIYFGDDDSILLANSLNYLYDTLMDYDCDAVMARPLVAGPNFRMDKIDKYIKWRLKRNFTNNINDIYDITNLKLCWKYYMNRPITVPCCPACSLVRAELARRCLFDVNYKGCAYREETDFFFRLNLDFNAKLMYDARAVQLNLPDFMVRCTGARTGGNAIWIKSAIENNKYFLEKNWKKIQTKYGVTKSIDDMQVDFIKKIQNRNVPTNQVMRVLKYIYFRLFVYR